MERIGLALTRIALITGTSLTCWGLAHMPWPSVLPWWGTGSLIRYAGFLAACFALVMAASYWSRRSALVTGAYMGAGFALLAGSLWPLVVTIWFAVASAIVGRAILKGFCERPQEKDLLASFLFGAGFYGVAIGLLAHFPVNYPGVYGMALAIPVILSWRVIIEEGGNLLKMTAQRGFAGAGRDWLDVAIAVIGMVHFIVAFMPEVGQDALAIHLFVPAHLALRHQWGFDAGTYVWAVIPMLGDWIFSVGYLLAGETAARLINVGFIFIVGLLVRDLALWAGSSAVGARWAVLIFLSTPLTFTESSSLFIESVWASFFIAGLLAVFRFCSASGSPKSDIPLAGGFLGFALAAKAVTLMLLSAPFLFMVLRYRLWFRGRVVTAALAVGLVMFLGIGSIPYLTAWKLTGNPVFPFFNHIFKSVYYPTSVANFAAIFNKGLTWDILYQATFDSGKYLESKEGSSGFQWLLLFMPATVALVTVRHRKGGALLLTGILIVALVFHSTGYFRYAFPAWPILAAAIGVALGEVISKSAFDKYWWYSATIGAVALNIIFLNAGAQYGDFPLKSITDASNRESYLRGRLPIRGAVELVNNLNTGHTPVAAFSDPLTAGLSANALYPSWYNYGFQKEIISIKKEQDVVDVLFKRNVEFIILDSNWNGINCCPDRGTRQNLIKKVTEQVAEFGSISVRKIKADYRFKKELLINPDFASVTGWALGGEAKHDADAGIVLVNVSSSATQVVAVSGGQRYRNTVVARCAKEPATGRIQINWINAEGQFVTTDIKTFECSPDWVEHTMEVTAPPTAASAIVYVTGHTPIPLEFKGDSLRQ